MTTRNEKRARELVEAALDDLSELRRRGYTTGELLGAAQVHASLHLAFQQAKAAEHMAKNAALVERLLAPPVHIPGDAQDAAK